MPYANSRERTRAREFFSRRHRCRRTLCIDESVSHVYKGISLYFSFSRSFVHESESERGRERETRPGIRVRRRTRIWVMQRGRARMHFWACRCKKGVADCAAATTLIIVPKGVGKEIFFLKNFVGMRYVEIVLAVTAFITVFKCYILYVFQFIASSYTCLY